MEDNTRYVVNQALKRLLPQSIASSLLIAASSMLLTILTAQYLGSEAMVVTTLTYPLWILFGVFYLGLSYG